MSGICRRCYKPIRYDDEYCEKCFFEAVREERAGDDLDRMAFEQQYNDRENLV